VLFGHGSDPVVGSGLRFGAPAVAVPGYGAPDQYQQQWNQQDAYQDAPQDAWTAAGWTPEQIAAWEAQQGLPPGAAQSWTQDQIAAWHAQQHQGAQPGRTSGGAWSSENESERTQVRPAE
jgi:aquaporin Z